MVVCKFFLQGNCRFGENCRNEHPSGQSGSAGGFGAQNRFGALSNTGNNRFGSPSGNPKRYNLNLSEIRLDLTKGQGRPEWLLSMYGAGKDTPASLFEGNEFSPEEVRVRFYEMAAKGQEAQADQEAMQLWMKAEQDLNNAASHIDDIPKFMEEAENKHPNRYDFLDMDGTKTRDEVVKAAETSNNTSSGFGTTNAFGAPSNSQSNANPFAKPAAATFGQPSGPSAFGGSTFGKPAQPSTSAFGQPAFGQSAFGSSTAAGFGKTNSAFGQPNAPSAFGQPATASAFGQPATASAFGKPAFGTSGSGFGQSAFGQTAQPTTTSAFGQPPQRSTSTSGFGQPSQPSNQSPFGQPAATPAFGASAFGQPAKSPNPFAAPSAGSGFGSSPSAFGQPAQSASAFGQPSQSASAFGQPSQPASAFGQPSQPASAFGQPSQPGSGFGQSAFGKPAQPSAFGQSAFGQPAQPSSASPFGQPVSGGSGFGVSNAGNASPFGHVSQQNASPFLKATEAKTNEVSMDADTLSNNTTQMSTQANPFGTPQTGMSAPQTTTPAAPAPAQPNMNTSSTPNPLTSKPPKPLHYTQTLPQAPPQADMSKRLISFRNQRVQYLGDESSEVPCYNRPDGRGPERIWFPEAGVAQEVVALNREDKVFDLQEENDKYTENIKQQYAYLFEEGRFKDGMIPLVPPLREWCIYDF